MGLVGPLIGVGGAIVAVVIGVILTRLLRGRHGKGNVTVQTGNHSPADVRTVGDIRAEGNSVVLVDQRVGFNGEEVNALVDTLLAAKAKPDRQRALELSREADGLRANLAAAIRRAEDAERRGVPDADDVLEKLRANGDTARLLEFLAGRIQLVDAVTARAEEERISLSREISAVAFLRGDIDTAESAVAAILHALPEDLEALNLRGRIQSLRGDLDAAIKSYQAVRQLGEAQGDQQAIAAACGNLGLIYRTRGDLDEAEGMHRKALEINKKLDRKEGMANPYGNLGLIYKTRGDLDEAERMHRKALEINRKLGRKEGMANAYGNLGLIYRTRGDLDEAERMHRKALEIEEKLGRKEGMASEYGNLGLIYRTRGDLDEAERMQRKSLALNKKLGRKEGMAAVYGNLGVICRIRGDLDEAEGMLRKALEIEEQLGRKEGVANAYGNLGNIYLIRGDLAEARRLWTRARDLYSGMGIGHKAKKVQDWIDGLDDGEG